MVSFKELAIRYKYRDHSHNMGCNIPAWYLLKLIFRQINGSNTRTTWNAWFKLNLKKLNGVTYQSSSIFTSIPSSFRTFNLIFTKFLFPTINRLLKKNSLKSMVWIKLGQKLWSHEFKIWSFSYQLRDYFGNMGCISSSLPLAKMNVSTNK